MSAGTGETKASETPQVDALERRHHAKDVCPTAGQYWQTIALARQLERELAAETRARERAEKLLIRSLALAGYRIVAGKNGRGFAYVHGGSYPVEGPGDGSRFAAWADAADAALAREGKGNATGAAQGGGP